MKIHLKFFMIFALSILSLKAMAKKPGQPGTLDQKIERILTDSGIKKDKVGLYLFNEDKVLFAKQAHQSLNPASAIKILVTAAALEHWGQSHKFQTRVWFDQNRVCIKGGLDPYFVSENLWLLGQKLKRFTPGKINRLSVDSTELSVQRALKKDFLGDSHRAFTAPQSALALNFNSITVHIYPAKKKGALARVAISPDLPKAAYVIKNTVKTVSSAGRKSTRMQASFDTVKQKLTINVSGTVGINEKERLIYGSMPQPKFYFAQALKAMFLKEGLVNKESGLKVDYAACPQKQENFIFKSKPLTHIIWGMNKYSNNFMAEMLSYALKKDNVDLQSWMKNQTYVKDQVYLDYASGLSRNTKVSAHDLAKLFHASVKNSSYGPEFLHAMSVSGQDGTLRNRFKNKAMLGKIRAKSGTLSNATALVGQAQTESYGTVYFAMLWNHTGKSAWQMRQIEEKILSELF